MTGRARREVEKLRSELEQSRPYLGLAREIQQEIDRAVADPDVDLDELSDAFERWPRDARADAVRTVFREMPRREQWAVLERLFDDVELRDALEQDHQQSLAEARRTAAGCALLAAVRDRRALDTRAIEPGRELTIGLFREGDVHAALARGSSSTAAARRVVLRASDEPGRLHVIEDVFNPDRGLFVTPEYDEERWSTERLPPHGAVSVGSVNDGASFEPVVYPGGRLDVEVAGIVRTGLLHAGYAVVNGVDLFAPTPTKGDRST